MRAEDNACSASSTGVLFSIVHLLVITILGFVRSLPSYEVWQLTGSVTFADNMGIADERAIRFALQPPEYIMYPDGTFDLVVLAVPDHSGVTRLPTLVVEHAGYFPVKVDLDDDGVVSRRAMRRRLELLDVLELRPSPAADARHD